MDRLTESRFPNQKMRNIKYSRESALHNSLPMPTNFSSVFVTRSSARGAKFNLARRSQGEGGRGAPRAVAERNSGGHNNNFGKPCITPAAHPRPLLAYYF